MKGKMWCLIHKKTGKIMRVGVDAHYENVWVIGFEKRKELKYAISGLIYNGEIRKIEFEY